MTTKRSKTFIPSGLDEIFESMEQRKAEAIAKGWIITEGKPKPKDEPQPKPQTETENAGGKK
jgi:hypothetical protein